MTIPSPDIRRNVTGQRIIPKYEMKVNRSPIRGECHNFVSFSVDCLGEVCGVEVSLTKYNQNRENNAIKTSKINYAIR